MAYKVDKNKKGFSSFQRIASNFQKMVGPAYAGRRGGSHTGCFKSW